VYADGTIVVRDATEHVVRVGYLEWPVTPRWADDRCIAPSSAGRSSAPNGVATSAMSYVSSSPIQRYRSIRLSNRPAIVRVVEWSLAEQGLQATHQWSG
jgi:hypothetical protein